jgi:beta-aspartyl-dipeptidase (metallo-type)
MLTLIENGEVYAPEPQGRRDVLLVGERIAKIGDVDRRAVEGLKLELEVIDASRCIVTPGFIDPHEHLLGGSGEQGFSTQTPEITLSEIVTAGITTVVGCLGVDTTMKTMPGLLARAKALTEEGITAHIWTGGYHVPPATITGSARNDIMFITEIIGAGEIAISDERSTDHDPLELAKLVHDTYVGGMLSRKAGVTHFHVGERAGGLAPLRTLIDEYEADPAWLYPTHVERNEKLFGEAIELTRQGATVDMDVMEEDLAKWLRIYFDSDSDPTRLTVSSDASISSPQTLFRQIQECVTKHKFPVERVLPLVTENTARVLKLGGKGKLCANADADILVLEKQSLEIVEVIARGRRMVKNGVMVVREKFLEDSKRSITLHGEKS